MDNNLIDLGTEFQVDLCPLSNNEAEFTIEQFIAALEATTTLTRLVVDFRRYYPTPSNNRRVVEPLCRCISYLRLHSVQHPLRKLTLWNADMAVSVTREQMQDVFAQFLVAAKQFGIFHLELEDAFYLPVQILVEFCRDNNSLKVLELDNGSFFGGGAALPLPLNNGPPNNSVIPTLDKLRLYELGFTNSTAATVFADLVAHVNVSSLILGNVTAFDIDDEDEEEDDDDIQITERILSELKMPSAEQLALLEDCRMEHFKAALDVGTTTVTDLDVDVDCGEDDVAASGEDDVAARVELLASFIRRAVKLNSLTITFLDSNGPHISLPPKLFQAMESCTTVTQIHVIRDDDLRPDEVQQLQKVMSRNRELDRFAANPGTYPTAELPELMRQFDNCPSGLYMLARCLPGVFSFDELGARTHQQKRKKQRENRDSSKDVGASHLKKVKPSNKGPAL